MAGELKDGVLREVERVFSREDVDYVRGQLMACELPMAEAAPESRVFVAVVWLSNGVRQGFDHQLENACLDWRDTLMAAGLGNENWREVLEAKGVRCDDW